MTITSHLNPKRMLRMLALTALACAALATSPKASAGDGFNGPFNPIAPDGSFTANGWLYETYPPAPGYTLPILSSYTLSPDRTTLTLVAKSPAGTISAGVGVVSFFVTALPSALPPGPLSYDWTVVFSEDVNSGELGFPGSAYDSGQRNLNFTANTVYAGHVSTPENNGFGAGLGFNPNSDNEVTCTITITNLVWTDNTDPVHHVVYKKGDAVPGVLDAVFTAVGVPATNASGDIAVLGKWSSPIGSGKGIVLRDPIFPAIVVTKVGDEVDTGVTIKALKDPVVNNHGQIAFPATLQGTGITSANDSVIFTNSPTGGAPVIVAQEGTQVPDAPMGALWKKFTSISAPDGGGGVLILGFIQQGTGGITAANDYGLWAADASGELHLILQEGTTEIGGKTVKTFAALKSVSGTPGQTHAFNGINQLTAKVTFTDGAQAIVKRSSTPANLLPNSDFTVGVDGLDGWTTTLNPPGTLTCCSASSSFVVNGPGSVVGPFDGSGPFDIDFNHPLILAGNGYANAQLAFTWNPQASLTVGATQDRIFSVQIVDGLGTVAATLYSATVAAGSVDTADHVVSVDVAATLNTLPAGAYTFRFHSFIPENFTGPATMHISALSFTTGVGGFSVLYTKGDAVPGVVDATFTGFGIPAINDHGAVAFLGKYKAPAGSGKGIFANGSLVAKVGDDLSEGAGTLVLRSVKDPVIDDGGHVGFPVGLTGIGVSPINDKGLVSTANGLVEVVAREGSSAPNTDGAFKSFSSLTLPGGIQGPLWLATLDKVAPITGANNQALFSIDPSGGQHVILQSGTTVIDAKVVKSFKVLKAVSGTPGQTHAFNGSWHVVSKVTFADGSQAIVDTILPGGSVVGA